MIVVSEETATISVVLGGEMIRGLDAPRLRVVLHRGALGRAQRLRARSRARGWSSRPVRGARRRDAEGSPRARAGSAG